MYKFIAETGVIVPDTADTRAQVEQEWKDALGKQDLVTTADTPQGVLITQETIARQGVAENNAHLANQINPLLTTGLFLDAICAFTGLERRKSTRTLVLKTALTGIPNTIINAGSRARTDVNDIFQLRDTVVLDSNGKGEGDFESAEYGPVHCPPGSLNNIVDAVLGWETVINPSFGILGSHEETDAALRLRRNDTLARQGISTVEAHISGLYDTKGVKSLAFRENIDSASQVIDGIPLKPHSIWACVDGGSDEDVATILFTNKTNGAAWNGETIVDVLDKWSRQTYKVRFDRPVERPIIVRVTVRPGISSEDPQTAVRTAIQNYADGQIPGERGFCVGESISPFELGGAINYYYPGLFVVKVEIAFVGESYQSGELPVALNEKATITQSAVIVLIV